MTSILAAIVVVLGIATATAAIIVLSSILNGWTLSILWGWFMVPTFGLPALSVVPAIGVAMVVSYLTYTYSSAKDPDQKWWMPLLVAVLRPVLALGIGSIVHSFM